MKTPRLLVEVLPRWNYLVFCILGGLLSMSRVLNGLDIFQQDYWKKLKGLRLGLLSNQASLDGRLKSSKEVISCILPGQLKVLFGPQHGYGGEDQDNMVETQHAFDQELNIPVFSLYSEVRGPSEEVTDLIDILIIDLQDVGTRVYTFASTMLNCLRALTKASKKVLILDRPNPLGGDLIEGNLLRPELYSFVGPFRLPMRHGLTMAEMARIFDQVFQLESDLEIIPMGGWERRMLWADTNNTWAMPHPTCLCRKRPRSIPAKSSGKAPTSPKGGGPAAPLRFSGPLF